MPFMKGTAPIRRTMRYLKSGQLTFRPEIRVMTVNYNLDQESSRGTYEFMFWHLPQIKYKNRSVQILKFKNMTPTPFIQFFFVDGEKVLVDLYGRTRLEILDHLKHTFCGENDAASGRKRGRRINPANFGLGCNKWCICEVPGQVPCPGYVPLPKHMMYRHKRKLAEELENS